jgi:hypothetical protein
MTLAVSISVVRLVSFLINTHTHTLRVFSNCELIRVIMPSAEMKERRERTAVTPARVMRNRLTAQLPVEIACLSPLVMRAELMLLDMSNTAALYLE